MNNPSKMPDDVIFWIRGAGETLIPILLEDLKTQLDRGKIPPDLPVYSSSQGQWLPLKSLLIDIETDAQEWPTFVMEFGPKDPLYAKTKSVRGSHQHPQQSVHALRTSQFATRLIAIAIGVYVFGSVAIELLRPDSKVFEMIIRIVPALLILIVCVLCLTGPIYFSGRGKDGKRPKWHFANKAAAILLGLASVSFVGRALWKADSGGTVRKANSPEPFLATSAPSSHVRELAEQWGQSMVRRDYARVADLTWRGTIEKAGGREALIEGMREIVKMLDDQGTKFVSCETLEPANLISEGDYSFAAVPTRGWFQTAKGRLVGESFAIGISTDGGKTWTFIDGASLSTPAEREAFVPKIPATLVIPPFKKAVPAAD